MHCVLFVCLFHTIEQQDGDRCSRLNQSWIRTRVQFSAPPIIETCFNICLTLLCESDLCLFVLTISAQETCLFLFPLQSSDGASLGSFLGVLEGDSLGPLEGSRDGLSDLIVADAVIDLTILSSRETVGVLLGSVLGASDRVSWLDLKKSSLAITIRSLSEQ